MKLVNNHPLCRIKEINKCRKKKKLNSFVHSIFVLFNFQRQEKTTKEMLWKTKEKMVNGKTSKEKISL